MNTYGYVGGNPVRYTDPDGLLFDPNYVPIVTQTSKTPVTAALGGSFIAGTLVGSIIYNAYEKEIQNSIREACGDNDCDRIKKEIYRFFDEINNRIIDLLNDRCNLYDLANTVNPGLPNGCVGTWQGHIHQLEGWQSGLRDLIEQARRKGCDIPNWVWEAATRPLPKMPRGRIVK